MTDQEKAKIILEQLDKKINVNWNMEKYYMDAICAGLRKVAEAKSRGESKCLQVT